MTLLFVFGFGCRSTGSSAKLNLWDEDRPFSTWFDEGMPTRAGGVEVAGAINETLSFRFTVRVGTSPLEDPRLTAAPFESTQGSMASSAIRLFRMHAVQIDRWPGWHIRAIPPAERNTAPLDVLVPLRAPRGGLPRQMGPNETLFFWADLAIPKGTIPGEYVSELMLESGSVTIDRLPIHVTVRPFVLPDEADVQVIAELDHRALIAHHIRRGGRPYRLANDAWRDDPSGNDVEALIKTVMRQLRSHRVTPILDRLTPIATMTAQDGVQIDWSLYDSMVDDCLSGRLFFDRIPVRHWPLPLALFEGSVLRGGSRALETHADWLRSFVASCARHFKEKGWFDRTYVQLPEAASFADAPTERVRALIACARGNAPPIPILSPWFPQDLAPFGWVGFRPYSPADSVDIWMPPAQFYDRAAMANERAAGRRTWMSIDRPPFSGSLAVQARATDVRILAWQAAALGAEVLHAGCINRWPDPESSPAPTDCVRFDPTTLLYPGSPFGLNEPVASVRLKHLRRSLQDVAYGKVLSDHGLEYVVTAIRESLTPYAGTDAYRTHFLDGRPIGWPQPTQPFEMARRIMAEELANSAEGKQPRDSSAFVRRTTTWRRFIDATRTVQLLVDGTRLRLIGTTEAPQVDVECVLTVVNKTRTPLSGTARFAELPEGWTTIEATRAVGPIERGGRGRIRLVARAPGLPVEQGRPLFLPIEFESESGRTYRVAARVACANAIPAEQTIHIDGDLSEWPPGSTNMAANFRLISGGTGEGMDSMQAGPRQRTMGFFVKDQDHLYIAINVEADSRPEGPRISRKRVDYEDMVPMGEELIEILIDPRNSGSRSPTDLYHIVVKRSGSDLFEKGVRFDPPCAERQPWPVDIDVATKISPGRWTVELKIPLAAFGSDSLSAPGHQPSTISGTWKPESERQAIWGFNIVRFDKANQEFSTWSGAFLNAYEPLSLGNLYLP